MKGFFVCVNHFLNHLLEANIFFLRSGEIMYLGKYCVSQGITVVGRKRALEVRQSWVCPVFPLAALALIVLPVAFGPACAVI